LPKRGGPFYASWHGSASSANPRHAMEGLEVIVCKI
jgi:hypothetical protein